jgi:hypothetical protein
MPAKNICLKPNLSPSRPAVTRQRPKADAYLETIHSRSAKAARGADGDAGQCHVGDRGVQHRQEGAGQDDEQDLPLAPADLGALIRVGCRVCEGSKAAGARLRLRLPVPGIRSRSQSGEPPGIMVSAAGGARRVLRAAGPLVRGADAARAISSGPMVAGASLRRDLPAARGAEGAADHWAPWHLAPARFRMPVGAEYRDEPEGERDHRRDRNDDDCEQ